MNALKRKFSILISEDDADYQFLYKIAISEINPEIEINVVYTGEQLVHYLLKDKLQRELNRQSVPNIIIGGLKPPIFSLRDVTDFKSFERFQNIPVYLFSDEITPDLEKKSIAIGVKAIMKKPDTFLELKSILESVIERNMVRRLTKGLFCCRCEDFIECDNEHGHYANHIKLSEAEKRFIAAKFQGSLCIPCLNQLKTSYKILKGEFENDGRSAFKDIKG